MAQKGISEYDAKVMFARFSEQDYAGVPVTSEKELTALPDVLEQYDADLFVVKPDQLFGKRGKHGLVGVKLDAAGVQMWISDRWGQEIDINGVTGQLNNFLVEPFVPHQEEYYISIETTRNGDRINLAVCGGVDIEQHWEDVVNVEVSVLDELEDRDVERLLSGMEESARPKVQGFVPQLFSFFRSHGLVYLECNPFVVVDDQVVCLDMVAKVDDCEGWKQRKQWANIAWIKPFGSVSHPLEDTVAAMDAETGASLKCTILHPLGRIGLLLCGGGAAVVAMDKLAQLGVMDQVINFGDLSGNPGYDHNKAYIQGLVDLMCHQKGANEKVQSAKPAPVKYLCLFGGIANFTRIDVLCRALVDALQEKVETLQANNIHLVIRRGGVNDTAGLTMVREFAQHNEIPHHITDGDVYFTEVFDSIILS